jgi:acyl-CoA thioester hydrolase
MICITNIPVQGGEAMFKKTLTPRLSELNGARHIGHNVIPVWLEEGYIEIIKLYNPELHWETETTLFLVNMNIDYMHELILGKDVEVITGIKKIGKTSLILNQKIFQGGVLCAKAASTFVNFEHSSKKATAFPPSLLEKLKEHIMAD